MVTARDVLVLKARLKYLCNPEFFNCLRSHISTTKNKIQNYSAKSADNKDSLIDELAVYEETLELYGCEPDPYEIDGYIYNQCPCTYEVHHLGELLELADQMELGNLPYSGGVLENPGKLMELIQLVAVYRKIFQPKKK